jgi:dihydropteroate synthase
MLASEGVTISIDTIKPDVAVAALAAGATKVNDVRCAEDPGLAAAAAEAGADYVIMHNRGRGEVKGSNIAYADVVGEVMDELLRAAERVERAGVAKGAIWLDPGLGFAKTADQCVELLSSLGRFKKTGYRVLVGPSRKSFIGELAPNPDGTRPPADDRLGGTAAAVVACVAAGVDAVRVHDVHVMRQVTAIAEALCVRAQGAP